MDQHGQWTKRGWWVDISSCLTLLDRNRDILWPLNETEDLNRVRRINSILGERKVKVPYNYNEPNKPLGKQVLPMLIALIIVVRVVLEVLTAITFTLSLSNSYCFVSISYIQYLFFPMSNLYLIISHDTFYSQRSNFL